LPQKNQQLAGSIFLLNFYMKTLITLILMTINLADQPRKVLLFHNIAGAQHLQSQLAAFKANQTGMTERDIDVVSIPYSIQNATQYKQWKVDTSAAFTFILVGRDGGEKHRSSEVVTTAKLFGLIDAMPMRKSEIKDGR
jgi:hypothetical protein